MRNLILWDFDNTLVKTNDLYFEQFFIKNIFHDLSKNKLKQMFLPMIEWITSSEILKYVTPEDDSIKTLEELSNYFKQECLTARPLRHSSIVQEITKKHFSPFIDNIHYLDSFGSKVEYAYNKLNAFVLIDDTISNFNGIECVNRPGILFDKENRYRHKKIDSNITKVSKLIYIPEIIYNYSYKT